MPGPPAKPDAVRRHPRVGPRLLPAEGRKGRTPRFPLPPGSDPKVVTEEAQTWHDLWCTPQSVEWERLGWTRVVARYCRILVGAERLDDKCMAEARQLEDKLGLTPKAMRMLMWEVVADEVTAKRTEKTDNVRERLRAVETG